MAALLHYLSLLYHQDSIAVDDGGESMCYDYCGPFMLLHQSVYCLLHLVLTFCVESRSSLVEYHYFGLLGETARNRDALFLPP